MSKAKRIAALIACIGLILVLFTSSAYIAYEADHDCVGEQCEICEHVQEAMALLRVVTILGIVALWLLALLSACRALHGAGGLRLHSRSTLVSWKVRLNN